MEPSGRRQWQSAVNRSWAKPEGVGAQYVFGVLARYGNRSEIAPGLALGGQREVNKAPRARSNTPEDIRLNDAARPGLPNSYHDPVVHS